MAGLFDFLGAPGSDQSQALGLLAAGMMQGNFGGGLLAANQQFSPDAKLKRELSQATVDNYKSEIAQRAAALQKQQQIQTMLGKVLSGQGGGAPAAAGQLGSGSFGIVQPPAGQDSIPARASGIGGANYDDIVALHAAGGPDLTKNYEFARTGIERKPGSFYEDLQGRRQYVGDPVKGITLDGSGNVVQMPNAAATQSALAFANADATERAKANYDPFTIPAQANGGNPTLTTRGALVQGLQSPQPQPTPAMPQPGLRNQGPGTLSPELQDMIMRDAKANGITNPQVNFTASGFKNPVFGLGQQAVQPPAQSAPGIALQSEAEKTRAVDTAKADVARDTATKADAKRYGQMSSGIDRAIELLQAGPTESGFGSLMDSGAAFIGKSTQGANLASQLSTLGGWLTSNVPRMEGPQSDRDVINYGVMSGMVGDATKPVAQRLAAAQEVKRLQQKYAQLNGYDGKQSPAQPDPAAGRQVFDAKPPANPANKGKRLTAPDGKQFISNGIQWVESN